MKKLLIFDFDGVLLDSLFAGRAMYSRILGELGYPPLTDDQYNFMKRSGPKDLLRYCLNDESLVKQGMELREKYREEKDSSVKLFDDVPETLESLSKKYLLAIATSRDKTVYDLLDSHNIRLYFGNRVISNEDYSSSEFKPHPASINMAIKRSGNFDLSDVVYIGDQSSDALAAKNAGVDFIGFNMVSDVYTTNFSELESLVI